jgi:hypothetical protein
MVIIYTLKLICADIITNQHYYNHLNIKLICADILMHLITIILLYGYQFGKIIHFN